jgi:hypothetical protein
VAKNEKVPDPLKRQPADFIGLFSAMPSLGFLNSNFLPYFIMKESFKVN